MIPNHVAILLPSVRKAADYLRQFNFQIGAEEEWDGEGTKEIYVGLGQRNSLLLMEPIKPGAYLRAMQKRGPGIHHLAITVSSLDDFLTSISGSGWLIHPSSIRTIRTSHTAYLARPGFPALIEVEEREASSRSQLFIEKISMPIPSSLVHLTKSIGLEDFIEPSQGESSITMNGTCVNLKCLF